MIRNHKLESKLAEEIVGYVLVNTDDYFAAEKELAQLSHNTGSPKSLCPSCKNRDVCDARTFVVSVIDDCTQYITAAGVN
jgi:hypothetical protein